MESKDGDQGDAAASSICENRIGSTSYLAPKENITISPFFCPAEIWSVGIVGKGSNKIIRSSAMFIPALVNHITSSFKQCPPLIDLSHMNMTGLQRNMLLNSAQAPYAITIASKQ